MPTEVCRPWLLMPAPVPNLSAAALVLDMPLSLTEIIDHWLLPPDRRECCRRRGVFAEASALQRPLASSFADLFA
jgi:hypothetical protein